MNNSPSHDLLPSTVADLANLLGGAPLADLPQWTPDLIGAASERREHLAEALVEWDKPENLAWARDYLMEDAPPAVEGEGGEHQTFKVAAELRDHGISELTALELMLEIYNERCDPPWDVDGEHGLAKKINNAYRYANKGAPGHATAEAQFGADPLEADAEADTRAAETGAKRGKKKEKTQLPPEIATTDDFYAYLPDHLYLYVPTRQLWPAVTINSILGEDASIVLDRVKPCQQMTWCPGKDMIIKDRLVVEGGWIEKQGANCFNTYLPPQPLNGDPDKAQTGLLHLPYDKIALRFPMDAVSKNLDNRDIGHGTHVTYRLTGPLGVEKVTVYPPVDPKDAITRGTPRERRLVAPSIMQADVAFDHANGQNKVMNVNDLDTERPGSANEFYLLGCEALGTLVLSLATRNVVKRTAINTRFGTGKPVKSRFRGPAGAIYLSSTTIETPPASEMENDPDHPAREGVSPRPHMRRGHLHTVVHGVGRSQRRVQWFPPVFVNADPAFVAEARKYVLTAAS